MKLSLIKVRRSTSTILTTYCKHIRAHIYQRFFFFFKSRTVPDEDETSEAPGTKRQRVGESSSNQTQDTSGKLQLQ